MVAASSATIVFPHAHVALQQTVHRHGTLQVRGDFPERALLRLGGLEGQHALERLADGRLAHPECDARLLLRCFPAQRNAQLVKEKFLKNQALLRLRAKRIQRFDRLRLRRKVDEVDRVAPGWKLVPREQLRGQRIGHAHPQDFRAPYK